MDRADIGVIQCGCGLGFALKTGEYLRVTGNFLRQELEGNEAMKPFILGLMDHPHASAPQLF